MTRLGRLWLTDFRCYEHVELDARRRLHGGDRQQRSGQDQPARGRRLARHRPLAPGVPDRVLVRTGADEAIVRAEIAHDDHDVLIEAAIRTQGRNRILAQQAVGHPPARPRRAPPGHRVRARRPRAGEGRAGGPARLRRRPPRRVDAAARRRDHRLRAGGEATQRAVARRHPQRGGPHRRATCSTRAGRVGRGADRRAPRAHRALAPAVRDAYASLAGDAPGFATVVRSRVERARR